jgi:hypothetical protein
MNAEKKPWLFLKRLSTWSPLGEARDLLIAPLPASGLAPVKERKAWKLHARWSLEA